MKRKIAGILVFTMLCGSMVSYAGEPTSKKQETVYVNLDHYGKVKQIQVYNDYTLNQEENIVDYGDYKEIQEITSKKGNTKLEDGYTWDTQGEKRLAYFGTLGEEKGRNIPWIIDLSYQLNGQDIVAEELLHKSGLVKVKIEVEPNPEAEAYYQNNYMLEITGSFDMAEYGSVFSEEATEVMTGRTKTLMFIVLPGQSNTFTIEIGTEDFEMSGLTFAMIPLTGDVLELVTELAEEKKDIEDAMSTLDDSMDIILDGMNDMNQGFSELSQGANHLKEGNHKIYASAEERNQSIENMRLILQDIGDTSKETNTILEALKEDSKQVHQMMQDMTKKTQEIEKTLGSISADLEDLTKKLEDLPEDFMVLRDTIDTASDLVGDVTKLLKLQTSIDTSSIEAEMIRIQLNIKNLQNVIAAMEDSMEKYELGIELQDLGANLQSLADELSSLEDMTTGGSKTVKSMVKRLELLQDHFYDLSTILDKVIKDSKDLPSSIENINQLIEQMQDIITIVNQYSESLLKEDNITKMIENLQTMLTKLQEMQVIGNTLIVNIQNIIVVMDNELYQAINEVSDGIINLSKDMQTVLGQSNYLKYSKNKISGIVERRWDKISNETTMFEVDPNAKAISFSSERNESPEKVQILLKTADIKEGKEIKIIDMEPEEQKVSFWDRIIGVFQKLWTMITSLFA